MKAADKQKLIAIFQRCYPSPRSELNFKNKYQLAVSVILSAQCTDKKVNEVTPRLFAKYGSFKKLSAAKLSDLEEIIRPINYYKTKARHLIAMAQTVISVYKGKLPAAREELMQLPGVGRKTANVIQAEEGIIPAFPVDTHVFRVSKRLGLAAGKTTDLVEEELMKQFPPEQWRNMHHWLIFHGRRICKASRPFCGDCPVAEICPSRFFWQRGA